MSIFTKTLIRRERIKLDLLGRDIPTYYFISDTHMGLRDKADNFMENEKKLCWFLSDLFHKELEPKKLILLGDIPDIWENKP